MAEIQNKLKIIYWEDRPPLYTDAPCLELVWSVPASLWLAWLPLNLVLLYLHFLLCLSLEMVDISCVSNLLSASTECADKTPKRNRVGAIYTTHMYDLFIFIL